MGLISYAAHRGPISYAPHRGVMYSLVGLFAVIELGLTGYRIHHTKRILGIYDPIIVELLVTSILTFLWIPMSIVLLGSAHRSSDNTYPKKGFGLLRVETLVNLILRIMWLVGAAIATNQWPTRSYAGPGKQGSILLTILAFAWMIFALMTIANIFAAMEYAARNAASAIDAKTATNNPVNNVTSADNVNVGGTGPSVTV